VTYADGADGGRRLAGEVPGQNPGHGAGHVRPSGAPAAGRTDVAAFRTEPAVWSREGQPGLPYKAAAPHNGVCVIAR